MDYMVGLLGGAGSGPVSLLVFLTWLVFLIVGVLLIMWLWQKISRR